MTFSAPKVGWWESITDFYRWWGEDYTKALESLKKAISLDDTLKEKAKNNEYLESVK